MTTQEAIDTLKIAIAEVEWNYPLDYAVAMEMAIKALEKRDTNKTYHTERRKLYSGVFYF